MGKLMSGDSKPNRWLKSRAYLRAKKTVTVLLESPKRLLRLVERVARKSDRASSGPISKSVESIKIMVRLVTAYAKGEYKDVAIENLVKITAALVYFVMPLDALPDFIAVFGLTDDAALLAWTFGAVKQEVERFLAWELEADSARKTEDSQLTEAEFRE